MKNDVIIIGGGIVGLATARQLQQEKPGIRVAVIEKETEVARHQTGHNSGVIHSGIYYKPGSLKALNCRRGYNMLLDFCRKQDVPFELCGKIIVATDDKEIPALDNIYQRGIENGLTGLKVLAADEFKEYEPHVNGVKGVFVPQTGIVDYKEVSRQLAKRIEQDGGRLFLGEEVKKIVKGSGTISVISSERAHEAVMVVNCAGLYSDKVAQMTGQQIDFRILPFRGEYYELKREKWGLVKNLIYPVPDPSFPFLGVHFTRMIGGGVEAGPNAVLAFRREGYKKSDVHVGELLETLMWPGFQKISWRYRDTGLMEMWRSFSKKAFTHSLQRLIPSIQESDLEPGGAGVRAQACTRKGQLVDDFMILESQGVVNVCNAPSPAATSSLSIGLTVAEKVLKQL